MATVINKDEAYAHLTDVIDRAMGGEEIEIEQGGAVKLRLIPAVQPKVGQRRPGTWKGRFTIPDDAFAPLTDDELKDWGL